MKSGFGSPRWMNLNSMWVRAVEYPASLIFFYIYGRS